MGFKAVLVIYGLKYNEDPMHEVCIPHRIPCAHRNSKDERRSKQKNNSKSIMKYRRRERGHEGKDPR